MFSAHHKFLDTRQVSVTSSISSVQNIIRDLKTSYIQTKSHIEALALEKQSKSRQLQDLVRQSSEEGHYIGTFRFLSLFRLFLFLFNPIYPPHCGFSRSLVGVHQQHLDDIQTFKEELYRDIDEIESKKEHLEELFILGFSLLHFPLSSWPLQLPIASRKP